MLKKPRIDLVCHLGKLNCPLITEESLTVCISTYLITGIYEKQEM